MAVAAAVTPYNNPSAPGELRTLNFTITRSEQRGLDVGETDGELKQTALVFASPQTAAAQGRILTGLSAAIPQGKAMLSPISTTAYPAATPPVMPLGREAEASAAQPLAASALAPAAMVELSDLGQFLSTAALSRRQLLELQGARDDAPPSPTQPALLNDAAEALTQPFKQLPPVSSKQPPLLDDENSAAVQQQINDQALRDAINDSVPAAPSAELLLKQQLDVARQLIAEQAEQLRAATQADGQPGPNAADPALAAAIAANNAANFTPVRNAGHPVATERLRPVTAVKPVQPAASAGQDSARTAR